MEILCCPYCGQEKTGAIASEFVRCRFCGFRSALVDSSRNGRLLIVDRRMPFLRRKCEDLASQLQGVTIVVDRRVVQDAHGQPDRRINGYDEVDQPVRAQPLMDDNTAASPGTTQ